MFTLGGQGRPPTKEERDAMDAAFRSEVLMKVLHRRGVRNLVSWGRGREGQLGRGWGEDAVPMLGRVELPSSTLLASAGLFHSLAATSDGVVWAFGKGAGGRLGSGVTDDIFEPHPVFQLKDDSIECLAAGGAHSGLVASSGAVYMWGYDGTGQVGIPNRGPLPVVSDQDNMDPWVLPTPRSETLNADGELWALRPTRIEIPGLSDGDKVTSISCGGSHTAAVTAGGHVFTWGRSDLGRLGREGGSERSYTVCMTSGVTELAAADRVPQRVLGAIADKRVVQISCGGFHTAAITADGELFAWGAGENGELGLGENRAAARWQPTLVESLAVAGHRVAHVSCGGYHTAALTTEGRMFTFGANHKGQLGVGSVRLKYFTPEEVCTGASSSIASVGCGGLFTTAVLDGPGGEIIGFGDGVFGQMGNVEGSILERGENSPVRVGQHDMAGFPRVVCGSAHALVWNVQ